MDNDNKIENNYSTEAKEVSLFLSEELIPLKKKKTVTTYNLEEEYAKTRKNRSISIWIIIGLTVGIVCLATWGIVSGMTARNENVHVSLNTFEDLNMRNLFDALSKTQDLYEKASKNKAELQAAFDSRMEHAKKIHDSDLQNLKRMKLSKKQYQEKEWAIKNTFNKTKNLIHTDLDEQLKAAEIELKQYEEQLKSFDSENIEKAQTWEKEMDSQRQLHEIEKNKLTNSYESQLEDLRKQMKDNQERSYQERRIAINDLTNHYESRIAKLDPVIKDGTIKQILTDNSKPAVNSDSTANGIAGVPVEEASTVNLNSIKENVTNTDEVYEAELESLTKKYNNYITLNDAAQKIPFANGMAKIVSTERNLTTDMVMSIAKTGAERISKLKTDNSQLSITLEKANAENARLKNSLLSTNELLDAYAKSVKADGFVLSYEPGSNTVVYIATSERGKVKNDGSTTVAVFDSGKKKIATGAIWFKDSIYYLSLDEEVENIPYGAILKVSK